MQGLKTRIAALEANIKGQPSQRYAVDVAGAVRVILAPQGLEVPDSLPGELYTDWIQRLSGEALGAILHYHDSQR